MYKITFSSYRCIHLREVLVEVSVFFLFFITLIPGGLLPTFPIISIPLCLPFFPLPSSLPSPCPSLGGGGGGREGEEEEATPPQFLIILQSGMMRNSRRRNSFLLLFFFFFSSSFLRIFLNDGISTVV